MCLENRVHYALPLSHFDFENIRTNVCIRSNNETVDSYRYSEDVLFIQVKCYIGHEIPSMSDLVEVDDNDVNWIHIVE